MAAILTCEMGDTDKVKEYVDDARRIGIEVLPPDVRCSGWDFERRGRRHPLRSRGHQGHRAAAVEAFLRGRDALVAERRRDRPARPCAERVDPAECPRLTWEALVKAGAFDFSGHNRGAVLAALDGALSEASRAAADRRAGQGSLFDAPRRPGGGRRRSDDGIDDSKAFRPRRDPARGARGAGLLPLRAPARGARRVCSRSLVQRPHQRPGRAQRRLARSALAGLIVRLSESVVKSGTHGRPQDGALPPRGPRGRHPGDLLPAHLRGSTASCSSRTPWSSCRGKVEERSEEPALILDEVLTVDDALRRFEGGLMVHLEPEDDGLLPQLKQTLLRHPGQRPLFFQVVGRDGACVACAPAVSYASPSMPTSRARSTPCWATVACGWCAPENGAGAASPRLPAPVPVRAAAPPRPVARWTALDGPSLDGSSLDRRVPAAGPAIRRRLWPAALGAGGLLLLGLVGLGLLDAALDELEDRALAVVAQARLGQLEDAACSRPGRSLKRGPSTSNSLDDGLSCCAGARRPAVGGGRVDSLARVTSFSTKGRRCLGLGRAW